MKPMSDIYFTVDEVAKQLQVLPATVRKWLKSGQLKGIKIERLWRIRQEELDNFLKVGCPGEAERD